MRRSIVLGLVLIAGAAFAEKPGPTVEAAALEKLYRGSLEYCTATKQNEARVGFNCPASAKSVSECNKTGEISADQALSACVARRLSADEQKLWAKSPMNPVRPKP